MWLNEGLAMVTVDRFFEKSTLKYKTLDTLEHSSAKTSPGRYWKLRVENQDALVYHYVRGYWLTRYIEDTRPELLKSLLSQRHRHRALENKVATAYGMKREEFFNILDFNIHFVYSDLSKINSFQGIHTLSSGFFSKANTDHKYVSPVLYMISLRLQVSQFLREGRNEFLLHGVFYLF